MYRFITFVGGPLDSKTIALTLRTPVIIVPERKDDAIHHHEYRKVYLRALNLENRGIDTIPVFYCHAELAVEAAIIRLLTSYVVEAWMLSEAELEVEGWQFLWSDGSRAVQNT